MPSLLPIHLNGSNRTCNAMCNGKSQKTQSKAKLVLSNIGNGTRPTKNVQGQIKLKWACLIKHMAGADIQNLQGSKCKDQCQIKA